MENYLDVGKIVNTHGIKGEVRVQSITDKPEERYKIGSKLVIKINTGEYIDIVVKSHRVHKSFDLLTFENYHSINDVESFKGKKLQISEDLLPELPENVYYSNQIVGARVVDVDKNDIGRIKEIMFLPANDVWVVEREEKNDLLLPVIKDVIKKVDINKKEIIVNVLEGLDEDEN